MLVNGTADQQHAAASGFLSHESVVAQREASALQQIGELHTSHMEALQAAQAAREEANAARMAARTSREHVRVETLKITPAKYSGGENEPLLRWLVEMDSAIDSRHIGDDSLQVSFAMSCLAGRAKSWAYGKRMADPTAFPTYADFKSEIQEAFEPPKSEFRSRSEFLALRQGSMDLHAYVQRCRYLISSIVMNRVDNATQVTTFMTGLKDGPVKTYLFRKFPETMEEAISLALQEDFSQRQARLHGRSARSSGAISHETTSEPMEVDAIRDMRSHNRVTCRRCGKIGHYASDCRAPAPVHNAKHNGGRGSQSTRGARGGRGRRVSFANGNATRQGNGSGQ
jgi:Retrotransposon gag protein/Zinc knuckle